MNRSAGPRAPTGRARGAALVDGGTLRVTTWNRMTLQMRRRPVSVGCLYWQLPGDCSTGVAVIKPELACTGFCAGFWGAKTTEKLRHWPVAHIPFYRKDADRIPVPVPPLKRSGNCCRGTTSAADTAATCKRLIEYNRAEPRRRHHRQAATRAVVKNHERHPKQAAGQGQQGGLGPPATASAAPWMRQRLQDSVLTMHCSSSTSRCSGDH